MARPVYSEQFIVYTDAAPITEFEVPTGYTAVIRQITGLVTESLTYLQVGIQDDPSAPVCYVWSWEAVGLLVSTTWEGRVVVPALGIISLNLGSLESGTSVYVGGYLLTAE